MKAILQIFKNQLGMSMMEITVAAGVMGAAALGAGALMGKMGGSSREAEAIIEKTQFSSALNVYLNSGLGCTELKSASMDSTKGYKSTPVEMKISLWKFDGFKEFKTGTELRYNDIKKMTATLQTPPVVTQVKMRMPDGSYKLLTKSILRVDVILSPVVKVIPGKAPPEEKRYQHTYDLPVLVNSANQVEVCGGDRDLAETCTALQGTVKTTETGYKVCSLDNNCQSYGSYSTLNCYPILSGYSCDTSRGTSQVNPVTGNLGCPLGTSAVSTGADTWTVQVECGKKCTADVNNTIGFYTCLKCN